jgi:glycosyltransferase involved in cell wall biosynthesis
MKVGFDAKRAFTNFTGLGNYSRSTVKILADYFPSNSYYLYNPRVPDEHQIKFLDLPHHSEVHIKIPKTFFYELFPSAWRRIGITKDLVNDQIDLFHGLSHELPIGIERTKIPSVVTIHDLIFLRFPQYYKATDRKIYFNKFKHACEVADLIIAISEQTKKDIVHFFGIDETKIRVVYQSCASIFKQQVNEMMLMTVRVKYQLPERFLLNVGTIEKRKNALLIIKALKNLNENIPLVIIGRETSYVNELKDYLKIHHLEHRVIFLHKITFDELPIIYNLATMFIYPSRFEGFGIPIIEALQCGVPVIAARGSCLEEAGGHACLYVEPDDVEGMTNAINTLLKEHKSVERMMEGKNYVAKFHQEKIATDLMQVYTELLSMKK